MFLPTSLYTPTALNAAMAASAQKEQSAQKALMPVRPAVPSFVAHAPAEKKIAMYSKVRGGWCWR